jgi:Protein of unknown function (DUF2442)
MVSLANEIEQSVQATSVRVTDDAICVELEDGRTIKVPTAWYPRLLHATAAERENFEIDDVGIVWPGIDADFSIRGLLLGRKSGESTSSFTYWLEHRTQGRKVNIGDYIKHLRKENEGTTKQPQDLVDVERQLTQLSIYRGKHNISQKLYLELAKFVYARYRLLPKETKNGHLQYDHFLHIETIAKNKPSLTINLIGKPSSYSVIPGVSGLLVKPRRNLTRLRVSDTSQLENVFLAVESARAEGQAKATSKLKAKLPRKHL